MSRLHLTRVAYGCADLPALDAALAARARRGEVVFSTRNRPRRADELIGGHVHLIIRHMLVARVMILRFEEAADGRTDIVCRAVAEHVVPTPRRSHQGWRYLNDADAPAVLDGDEAIAAMPAELARELGALGLV